ncbi:MAG: EscU/YscU/HrcU family type III secretion system export apparatus switch protein [Pseudomonadota bacterium]
MSEEGDQSQEKSLPATERRREEARRKGDLARAPDAQAAIAYLGVAVAFALTLRWAAERSALALAPMLHDPERFGMRALAGEPGLWAALTVEMATAAAPVMIGPAALIIIYLIATRSIVFAGDKIMPKLSRISPIENAGQKYGPHGLGEFAKSTAKLTLLLICLSITLVGLAGEIGGGAHLRARLLPRLLEEPLWNVLAGAMAVAIVVGLADLFWQRHQHEKRLRMSHEDMKKELRESEGDPQLKARRRERAEEIARNRMLDTVPDAAVVITNPTHVAVALAWERGGAQAPKCTAKGADEVAARIRERAEEAGVPIHRDPVTARALFHGTPIGAEIEPEHYRAVAAAILFAEDLRAKQQK